MTGDLHSLTATEAVLRLKRREITPLDLIDVAARRIAEVEPAINALPTLCIERARAHAERLMRGESREAEAEPGWLAGLRRLCRAFRAHRGVTWLSTAQLNSVFERAIGRSFTQVEARARAATLAAY